MAEKELNLNDLKSVTMKLPQGLLKGENVDVYDTATGQQLLNVVGMSINITPTNTLAVVTFQVEDDIEPRAPWREFTKTVDLIIEMTEAV